MKMERLRLNVRLFLVEQQVVYENLSFLNRHRSTTSPILITNRQQHGKRVIMHSTFKMLGSMNERALDHLLPMFVARVFC